MPNCISFYLKNLWVLHLHHFHLSAPPTPLCHNHPISNCWPLVAELLLFTHTYMYTCMHTHTYICTNAHTCTYTSTQAHTCTLEHASTHIHIQACTHLLSIISTIYLSKRENGLLSLLIQSYLFCA